MRVMIDLHSLIWSVLVLTSDSSIVAIEVCQPFNHHGMPHGQVFYGEKEGTTRLDCVIASCRTFMSRTKPGVKTGRQAGEGFPWQVFAQVVRVRYARCLLGR